MLHRVFKSESLSGVFLILCVVIALIMANSPIGPEFEQLLNKGLGPFAVRGWINDGLMAIFFFLIGLEIRQELTDGHLSSFKKAVIPVLSAVGGAVVPAMIYFMLNRNTTTSGGWGIPMATDIAFALGVLSLLGKKAPSVFKAFLSTLAVADDLLAIMVIAIFYAGTIHWIYLTLAAGLFLLLLMLNRAGVQHITIYLVSGVVLWYLIHHSGVHATIAGVLTAFALPAGAIQSLIRALTKPVNFVIMPLFAIVNTNLHLSINCFDGLASALSLGIILGLTLGKPLGILLASWLTIRSGIGVLPAGLNRKRLAGLGLLAGIGFTMSIFLSVLSFGPGDISDEAKLAVLVASLLSGLVGFIFLSKQLRSFKA